jgi:molecular chaperone HscB
LRQFSQNIEEKNKLYDENAIPSNHEGLAVLCTKCQHSSTSNGFFCEFCHYLKNPILILDKLNYYEAFHLTPLYPVDYHKLEEEYYKLQRNLHPDKFQQFEKTLVEMANLYSAYINLAYHTLKDDYLRAKYLVIDLPFKLLSLN